MEIKKGISQMAEYPNVEINYVVPVDGQMYYVLRDGVLENGAVIATLDPKRAIDSSVNTDTIGVFAEDGSVLIDFDKKNIIKIDDKFLLVVNSIPKSTEVVNALKNADDEMNKTMMKDNSTSIVDKMLVEMGVSGQMLFSDAYSEANIYTTDGVNKVFGVESSFIGKNDKNFYFHTNDVSSATTVISIEEGEERPPVAGFEMPSDFASIPSVEPASETEEEKTEIADTSLDINQSIFGDFKPVDDEISSIETTEEEVTPIVDDNILADSQELSVSDSEEENQVNDNQNEIGNDAVLDNVIAVMKKMIEETSKLNKRITELEEEIREKNEVISREESKKSTLNDLLDEANEVLDNID